MTLIGITVVVLVVYMFDEPERFGHIVGRFLYGMQVGDPKEVERLRKVRLERRPRWWKRT